MIPPPPQLDPATSPDAYLNTALLAWWHWVLIVVAVAILIVLVVWLAKKFIKPVPPPTPAQVALKRIDTLMTSGKDLRQCATGLSLILRTYLTGTSEDPTLYETHQEFSMRANALMNLPIQEQLPVRNILQRMVQLKYEPNTPNDDSIAAGLAQETRDIIAQLERLSQLTGHDNDAQDLPPSSTKLSFNK